MEIYATGENCTAVIAQPRTGHNSGAIMTALRGTPGQNLSKVRRPHVLRRFLVFCLISVGCAVAQGPNAIPAVVFGPQAVAEPSGSPAPVQFQIALVPLVHGPYSLVVLNPSGATGTISLN